MPYRGFVEVREVMDRAINSGVALLVDALLAKQSERRASVRIAWTPSEAALLNLLRERGYDRITVERAPLGQMVLVHARHECGSWGTSEVNEIRVLMASDAHAVARVWIDALDDLRCYCVRRRG